MSTDTPKVDLPPYVIRLERENARLREELAQIRDALTGDDYASLPSDFQTVRMAHTIRADHDKFRNQVRDTCHRAEQAEARALANERDAEIGKAVSRAAAELPDGVDLEIALERGAGTVRLYLPDSDAAITDFGCDISFHAEINAAIDAAIGAKHD